MSLAEELKVAHLERRRRLWGKECHPVVLAPLPSLSGTGTGKMWLGLDFASGWDSHTRKAADIVRAVLSITEVSRNDFLSPRRTKRVAEARQLSYYFMRHFTRMSLPSIGQWAGGRDHSTVLSGIRRVERDVDVFGARVLLIAQALGLPPPGELQ